jgi:tRNA uridine 5-carboxymethylaminomethyl modification enzyme
LLAAGTLPQVNRFDVIVVGAGHAGIEAALASARMGLETACITLRLDRIGHLPCNCSIGGPAKGHIAREVDALGGQMGVTTDYALTHIRRVGTGKGPAVQTVRAHVCKSLYPALMQKTVASQSCLSLVEAQVSGVIERGGRVSGVTLTDGTTLECRAVILTTGTFLNGLCHMGRERRSAARHGDEAVRSLGDFLRDLGVRMRRFKTGTTPRVRLSTIDLAPCEVMESEPDAGPMSFLHDQTFAKQDLLPCWQTRTTAEVHELIQANLQESAMYSGQIEGVGPRYCPSIEDKVVRFADKDSHPIFLEKEEWEGESIYVQGVSTSLPADIQLELLRRIPGLEHVDMIRPGYAVEYDMADPLQLDLGLMSKLLPGLFLAGQINGTSGYEEAAGQGIVAGINAARFASDAAPVYMPRDTSFIGVMIDDLVTKGVEDPYRMLTARAEYRLLLRHDNADQRLTPLAKEIGLCSAKRWERFARKQQAIEDGRDRLDNTFVSASHNALLEAFRTAPVTNRISLFELLKRPELRLTDIDDIASSLGTPLELSPDPHVREQLDLAASYDGYLQQQSRLAERMRKLDEMPIPAEFDYAQMKALSYESIDKLSRVRPVTVGQASRIPGVRPSDIALLIGFIRGTTPAPPVRR